MRWRRALLIAGCAGWTALASVAPAHAGLFDDSEARFRIEQLRKQLDEAQAKLDGVARNQLDFANQFEVLRGDIARLNGQIEELKYALESTQKRQQDFYIDLDNRLRKIESAETPAPAAGVEPQAPAASTPAVSDADAYEKAITALKAGKAKEATGAFDAFIAAYPQSKLLGSAHYWNGYARSQVKDYRGAAAMFGKFADGWPDDARAADALESQADNLLAARDASGAKAVLQRLAERYPASEAGKRARAQLKKK